MHVSQLQRPNADGEKETNTNNEAVSVQYIWVGGYLAGCLYWQCQQCLGYIPKSNGLN